MITLQFRKQIRKYFYQYKKLLSIPKYWHVRIEIKTSLKNYAEVSYDYQEKRFLIVINPKLNKNINDLKDSILHELIHILFTPATARLELLLNKLQCNEKVNIKRTKKNMMMYEEAIVDHITKVIIKQEKDNND